MVLNLPAELAGNLLNVALEPLFISGTSVKATKILFQMKDFFPIFYS